MKKLTWDEHEKTKIALKSAKDALWDIANMQITEYTDKSEVLALCMSIAKLELLKDGENNYEENKRPIRNE